MNRINPGFLITLLTFATFPVVDAAYDIGNRKQLFIEGFSFADADSLHMNDSAKTVTWRQGESDISALAGKPVEIAFKLRSVKLYAFQFVD